MRAGDAANEARCWTNWKLYTLTALCPVWARIKSDGSVAHERDGDMTYVESDGAVLKKTEFVEAMMSGDGIELSRRTPTTIAAIHEDGVLAKSRNTSPKPDI